MPPGLPYSQNGEGGDSRVFMGAPDDVKLGERVRVRAKMEFLAQAVREAW